MTESAQIVATFRSTTRMAIVAIAGLLALGCGSNSTVQHDRSATEGPAPSRALGVLTGSLEDWLATACTPGTYQEYNPRKFFPNAVAASTCMDSNMQPIQIGQFSSDYLMRNDLTRLNLTNIAWGTNNQGSIVFANVVGQRSQLGPLANFGFVVEDPSIQRQPTVQPPSATPATPKPGSDLTGSRDDWLAAVCTPGTYQTNTRKFFPNETASGTCMDSNMQSIQIGQFSSDYLMRNDLARWSLTNIAWGTNNQGSIVFANVVGQRSQLGPLANFGFVVEDPSIQRQPTVQPPSAAPATPKPGDPPRLTPNEQQYIAEIVELGLEPKGDGRAAIEFGIRHCNSMLSGHGRSYQWNRIYAEIPSLVPESAQKMLASMIRHLCPSVP